MNGQEFEEFLRRKNEKILEDVKKFIQEHNSEKFVMEDTDSIIIRNEK